MWAVTTPYVNTVVPLADGTLHAIGYGSGQKFDTVSTPDANSNWVWHAEYDGVTGKGKLVHSFGTATGSGSTRAWDMGADTNGDLILTGAIYSGATSVYFDTEFTFSYPEDDAENHLFVLKLKTSGTKVKPSCLSTCNNDGSPVVDPNSCYIDGLCYADGETADVLGVSCVLCDVSKSQTEWSYGPTLGVTQCYIDGECKEGNHSGTAAQTPYLRDRGGVVTGTRYAYMYSKCRYCNPTGSITEWSVRDGWQLDLSQQILDECECVAGEGMCDSTGSTTDAGPGDSTDTTTETGGGTLSESDGAAGTTVAAGALASLAALLL